MGEHMIPEAAFDEDAVVLAKKGAGKTVLTKGIVERSLDKGERCLIIDPKGDWWGLKSSADGQSEGYPIAIFGGQHQDMPFNADVAAPLAKTIAETNLPAIIDVSDMTRREMAVSLTVFLKSLYKHNKNSLFLVFDEVHLLAPQTAQRGEAYELREVISQIVTLGRQRGFRLMSVCQRPQLVDKTLITQADTQIAMRLLHKLDRAPALSWLEMNSPDDFYVDAKKNIGSLKVGEAFVGSAGAEYFERIRVPMNQTFDSSATPKRNQVIKRPKTLAQVDLSAFKKALKPDDDPAPAPDQKNVRTDMISLADHKRILSEQQDQMYKSGYDQGIQHAYGKGYHQAASDIRDHITGMTYPAYPENEPRKSLMDMNLKEIDEHQGADFGKRAEPRRSDALSKGAAAVLQAFKDVYPRAITVDQAAVMAGRSLKSSAYPGIKKEVQGLEGSFLTNVSNDLYRVADLHAGSAAVSAKSVNELIRIWASKFSPAVGKMLNVLFENRHFSSKDEWAEASGVSPRSSTVGKAIKELRVNGLLTSQGDQILIHENFREEI